MLTRQRQELIVKQVQEKGSVTVNELSEMFDASESTIRRDIVALDKEGKLTKVFGGAVALSEQMNSHEYTVTQKNKLNLEEKIQIAKYAAGLIEPDDFVYIDAGTTTGFMIDFIEESRATYVTNAVDHAKRLVLQGMKVFLLGGELKASTEAVIGVQAAEALQKYHFTKGFFGTNGVTKKCGCTTPDVSEAIIKRTAIEHCKTCYMLCDSTKFGQISSVTFADFLKPVYLTEKKIAGYEEYDNILVVQ